MSEENMVIIGVRVPPGFREWAKEAAELQGETFSEFLRTLIQAGVEQMFPLEE